MGGTLLLADDSITIQKVVELTFAETEHKVVAVGSGRDLFARLPEIKPDVVLCDVVMPDINGYEVCQTLKSDPNTLHIPVVLLTGTFEPFDRDRALAAGCDAIVTKPFEARELINVVEDLLRRAQSVAAIPMPGEAGGLDDQGIPEGVPSLDFSTAGFDQLAAQIQPPSPMPEDGIELTASSLGDSHPSKRRAAPPELVEPEIPTAVSALSQSFAFGGDEALPSAPIADAFALEEPAPALEAPKFAVEAPAPAPEVPHLAVEPRVFAPEQPKAERVMSAAADPFAVRETDPESAHELFAAEPAPAPEPTFAPVLPPLPVGDEMPTQHLLIRPTNVPKPAVELAAPAPAPVESVVAAAAPLAIGALSTEVVEQVMRRVKELIPPPPAAPAPPTAAELLTDEHVERIARRAAELVPPPPALPTAAELITDEHVERVAKRAAELVPAPPAPPTAAELLTDEHVERIARRAAELVPAPPTAAELLTDEHVERVAKRAAELVPAPNAPPTAAELLTDEHVERIARRAAELVPAPLAPPTAAELLTDEHVERVAKRAAELVPAPPTAAELLTDEHVERVAKRAAELVPPPAAAAELSDEQVEKIAKRVVDLATPLLERIAWEVIPDMAEMMVRKRIAELEKAAEEES
jgi:CheY-like chemotaxis protein